MLKPLIHTVGPMVIIVCFCVSVSVSVFFFAGGGSVGGFLLSARPIIRWRGGGGVGWVGVGGVGGGGVGGGRGVGWWGVSCYQPDPLSNGGNRYGGVAAWGLSASPSNPPEDRNCLLILQLGPIVSKSPCRHTLHAPLLIHRPPHRPPPPPVLNLTPDLFSLNVLPTKSSWNFLVPGTSFQGTERFFQLFVFCDFTAVSTPARFRPISPLMMIKTTAVFFFFCARLYKKDLEYIVGSSDVFFLL